MNEFENIAVGDTVWRTEFYFQNSRKKVTVARLTSKQIVLEGGERFWRKNGVRVGQVGWSHVFLERE